MPDSNRLDPATTRRVRGFEEVVTLVVKHRVKAGFEVPYEAWLRRIVGIAGQSEGHLGVDVIRGKNAGLDMFPCVLRFCSTEAMQPLKEFWFAPQAEAGSPPPRWKQSVVTLLVILPHTLLVPLIWGPLLKLNAFLSNYVVATFLITVTIVVSVVYLFMPRATRLFAPWLTAGQSHSTQPEETR